MIVPRYSIASVSTVHIYFILWQLVNFTLCKGELNVRLNLVVHPYQLLYLLLWRPVQPSLARSAPWWPESPFWASFFGSETRSWSVARSGKVGVPFRSFVASWGSDSYGTPFPAPKSGNGCKFAGLVSVLQHKEHTL